MTIKRDAAIAGLVFLGIAAGFLLGSLFGANVFASGSEPGSPADPLVARSYVDEQVEAYISRLEKEVAALSERALKLEQALAQLQRQAEVELPSPSGGQAGTPSGGSSAGQSPGGQAPGSSTPAGTSPGGQTPGSQSSGGAKLLYIKPDNSYVNLRKGPGTNHEYLGRVERGNPACEPMTVLGQAGDWYQVRLPDGRTGWVAGWLVYTPG
ncbi:MAG: SH3 domain-containing protein [Bacillota bacterium]|jgi:TolA-binding protein|nr:SH3 domain-containing protein [Bacillota bacterium]